MAFQKLAWLTDSDAASRMARQRSNVALQRPFGLQCFILGR
jgi:hypothetical protein